MKLHNDNCTPMRASCLGLLEHVEELPSPKLKPVTDLRSLVSTGTIRRSSSKRRMHRNLQRHHTNRLLPSIVCKHRTNLLGARATHRHLQNGRFGIQIKEKSSEQTIFFNIRNAKGKGKREKDGNKSNSKKATSMTSRKCLMQGRKAVLRFRGASCTSTFLQCNPLTLPQAQGPVAYYHGRTQSTPSQQESCTKDIIFQPKHRPEEMKFNPKTCCIYEGCERMSSKSETDGMNVGIQKSKEYTMPFKAFSRPQQISPLVLPQRLGSVDHCHGKSTSPVLSYAALESVLKTRIEKDLFPLKKLDTKMWLNQSMNCNSVKSSGILTSGQLGSGVVKRAQSIEEYRFVGGGPVPAWTSASSSSSFSSYASSSSSVCFLCVRGAPDYVPFGFKQRIRQSVQVASEQTAVNAEAGKA